MQHHPQDAQDAVIARSLPLVRQLCREVDPEVEVTLTPYRWHGEALLDIGLAWGGHEHHLEVTAARLEIVARDHELLKHDIEEAVHDLHRHGHPAATSEAGSDTHRGAPSAAAHAVHTPAPEAALDPRRSPAAEAAGLPHGEAEDGRSAPLPAQTAPAPAGTTVSPDAPETRDIPGGAPATASGPRPSVVAAHRDALDRTMELTRHIVAELDPEADVSFEEYPWHGEMVLDILLALHGHEHHLEVTASRAGIILRDPEILHHDLEGIIHDLHREHPTESTASSRQSETHH